MSKSSWFCSLEDWSVSSVAGSGDSSCDGEFEAILSEKVRFRSSDVIFLVKDCSSNNRNGVSWGSVITSHIHVKLTDSTVKWNISVLFIHVVDSSSWLIPENYSKSFDMVWSFLIDFINREDLTLGWFSFELPS